MNRIVRLVVAACLVATMATTSIASDSAVITVSDGNVNAGETVELDVTLTENPGVSGASLTIVYDATAMTLESIKNKAGGTFAVSEDGNSFSWLQGSNITEDFTIVTLTFSVRSSAGGNYEVSAKLTRDRAGNLTNADAIPVPVVFQSGVVTVTPIIPPSEGGAVSGDSTSDDDETEDKPDVSSCAGGETCPVNVYTDCEPDAWYHDGVHFCLDTGLMGGYTDNTFRPTNKINRGMIVTILWRHAGSPAPTGDNNFSDVSDGSYCAEAVAWAAENGITTGYGDDTFRPTQAISRQQLAAFLWRYADFRGADISVENECASSDVGTISAYALEAISWATENGIMQGYSDDSVRPQATASRAHAAVMIQRFCGLVEILAD